MIPIFQLHPSVLYVFNYGLSDLSHWDNAVSTRDTLKSSSSSFWYSLYQRHTKQNWKDLNTITLYMTMHLAVHSHTHKYKHWVNNEPCAPKGVGDVFGGPSNREFGWQWLLCVCVFLSIHSKRGSPMMCETWSSSIPRVTSTWWSASRSCREGGAFDFALCLTYILNGGCHLKEEERKNKYHSFYCLHYTLTLKKMWHLFYF